MKRVIAEMMQIYSQKAHYHEEELEIILVLKGSITIHKIQRSVTIHENELTFINRFIAHRIESQGAYILSVKIKLSEFKDIFDKIEYVEFLNNDELRPLERPLKERLNAIVVDLLIKLYHEEDSEERRFDEHNLMHMLFTSYQLISHTKTQEEYLTLDLQQRYYSIVEYIMVNMNQKIGVDDILKRFYMNPAYFSQFMKKINGEGFKSFASYRKLIRIMDYLLDDELSMSEIANAVGILNMKSFYALFNKYFAESPMKWKERMKETSDHYQIIDNQKILQAFIKKYRVDKHRDNTIYKLYKYLVVVKANRIDMENVDIVLNPYLDMGEDIDEDYQVYKFLDVLVEQIKLSNAHFKLVFPFRYLKDSNQKQLLYDAIRLQILQYGINEIKKWKICFCIEKLSDLKPAFKLKEELEQRLGALNIQIALDALGG